LKILFIDGYLTDNGWLCIHKNGRSVCGDYINTRTTYYKTWKCEIETERRSNKRIRVVKQKSKWHTFRILCHELAHWLFDIIPSRKLRDRLDDWLDRD